MYKCSEYCIKECPIGKPIAENYLHQSESILDAVYDMKCFVNNCKKKGCKHSKELEEFENKTC